jgi:hypothetical protein
MCSFSTTSGGPPLPEGPAPSPDREGGLLPDADAEADADVDAKDAAESAVGVAVMNGISRMVDTSSSCSSSCSSSPLENLLLVAMNSISSMQLLVPS